MTKADLVEKVTQLGDLTRRDGEVIVETVFDSVISALQSGDKIEIRGFGSFRIRQRNPRIGRNPFLGRSFSAFRALETRSDSRGASPPMRLRHANLLERMLEEGSSLLPF